MGGGGQSVKIAEDSGIVVRVVVSDGTTTVTTTVTVDAAGNRKSIVAPDAGTITTTYTGLNEVRTQTDGKGQLSTLTYDVLGRLSSLVSVDGTSTWTWDTATNGAGKLKSRSKTGFSETYFYNSESRLSSVVTNITPIGGSSVTVALTAGFPYRRTSS